MRRKFTKVDTQEGLEKLDKFLVKGNRHRHNLIAFDTETNGLHFYKNVVIGFSISTTPMNGWYVPLLEWEKTGESKVSKKAGEHWPEGQFRSVWDNKIYPETVTPLDYHPPMFIKRYLEKWTNTKLVMHNGPFDCNMVMYNMDIDLSENLFCDTRLLAHFINEELPTSLKDRSLIWKDELAIPVDSDVQGEQKELGASVIRNGGKFSPRIKHVWRGDGDMVSKYACADTSLTLALYDLCLKKLQKDFSVKQIKLFFQDEIMPLCKEVVIPMQMGGVRVDTEYFKTLQKEISGLVDEYEDKVIKEISDNLEGFSIGKGIEEAVSKRRILKKLFELENLPLPQKDGKESLAKAEAKKAYKENPHWLYGYCAGEDELKYSKAKMKTIKDDLYREVLGRRYRFNPNSDMHLRWLLYTKLKNDKTSVPQTKTATKENPIPSCAAEVLEEFYLKKYSFMKNIMTYRKLAALNSKYVNNIVALDRNGWLHLITDQAGTVSGRFACKGGLNLQTLPRVENTAICTKCESTNLKISRKGSVIAHTQCQDCMNSVKDIICYSVVKLGFIAPEGYKIVTADYASLEPKIFSFMSGSEKLKDIYKKGLDLYSKVFCDVEGMHHKYSADKKDANFLKTANPGLRNMVKPVVLGIPYGAKAYKVAALMGFTKKVIDRRTKKKKEVIDVARGTAWRDKYLNTYPELRDYMDKCEHEATKKGYMETIIGRRKHFKYSVIVQNILEDYGVTRSSFVDMPKSQLEAKELPNGLDYLALKRFSTESGVEIFRILEKGGWLYVRNVFNHELDSAKNFKIQGLAAHIANKAMIDVTRLFYDNDIDGYIFLQTHDEIGTYVREDQIEEAEELLRIGMEENSFAKKVDVPMEAEPTTCNNLKESK